MTKLDQVLKNTYSNKCYSKLGTSFSFGPPIVIGMNDHSYIVFIASYCGLNSKFLRYEYVLYSVDRCEVVEKKSDEYQAVVTQFPGLDNPDLTGASFALDKKFRLEMEIKQLVNLYLEDGKFTEDIKCEYLQCLKEFGKMQSSTLRQIYECLAEYV